MIDLAIIGGGPGGLSAGLYATRGGIKNVVLFEKGMPGGQITSSSEIENYPGVSEIKSGFDFMQPWQEQCFRFGLKQEMVEVVRVSKKDKIFEITLGDGSIKEARAVIVATGGTPKKSGIKGEKEFWGKGVSACATCDGFFYKNKEVAVLGGGDTALEESIFLAKICSKVTLIHRREEFRAAPVTVEKAKSLSNITMLTPYVIEEILGNDSSGVTGLRIKQVKTNETTELNVAGIFELIGYDVNNQVLIQQDGKPLCELNQFGQAKVDLNMQTNIAGLYAIGDVRQDAPKQVVCAASDGAIAAIRAVDFLEHHHG